MFYTFSAHIFDREYEDTKLYPFRIKDDSKLDPEYDSDEPSNNISNAYLRTTWRLSLMSHINFHSYVSSMFLGDVTVVYIPPILIINRTSHWGVYEFISLMFME